jgi:hypothetical protein
VNNAKSLLIWALKFLLLFLLFTVLLVGGGLIVAGALGESARSEPGLVSNMTGLLAIVLANVIVISSLILTSRWSGWRLTIGRSLLYYGAVTVVTRWKSGTSFRPILCCRTSCRACW